MDAKYAANQLAGVLQEALAERDRLLAQNKALREACQIALRRFSQQNGLVSEDVWDGNYFAVYALEAALKLEEADQ